MAPTESATQSDSNQQDPAAGLLSDEITPSETPGDDPGTGNPIPKVPGGDPTDPTEGAPGNNPGGPDSTNPGGSDSGDPIPGTTDDASATPPTDPVDDTNGEEEDLDGLAAQPSIEGFDFSPFGVIETECGDGAGCAGLTLTTVVNGGTATAADFTLKAVQNNGAADEFYFVSGVRRTVPRYQGSSNNSQTRYTLSITPNPAVAADYTQALACTPLGSPSGNNNTTSFNSAGSYVQFGRGNGGTPDTRYANCTFTMTYDPGINTATVQVQVGGDRTGTTAAAGVQGIQLGLFASLNAASPVDPTWGVCTSTATGLCEFKIPDTGTGGANRDRELYVRAIGPTSGTFAVHTRLGVGSSGENNTEYGFRVGAASNNFQLRGGNTYSSNDQFMLDSGNTNNIASGGVFQTVRQNPSFPPQCGISVALILDVSGSVSGYQNNLAAAATAMVDALTGTPSSVALFSFNNTAPANGVGVSLNQPNLQAVSTTAGANTVKSWYSTADSNGQTANFSPTGSTNWDRGIYQAALSGVSYDIAVIITDGNPTSYNSPAQGPGSRTRFRELENGIFSANALKAQGTRVIALGVGVGVSGVPAGLNLSAISGPTLGSDYFQAANYEAAGQVLREAALGSCAGSVTVVKQVVPSANTGEDISGAVPADGWTFNANSSSTDVTIAAGGITGGGTGAVNFPLTFTTSTSTADLTFIEQQQANHTLVTQNGLNAVCRDVATGVAVTVTNSGETGFKLSNVDSSANISCTVYNRLPKPLVSVQVDKKWVVNGVEYAHGNQPTGLNAALTLTDPNGSAATSQAWGTTRSGYTMGQVVTIAETTSISEFLTGCQLVDTTITNDNPPAVRGTVLPVRTQLPYDATLSQAENKFTVTNTVTCEQKLILRKQVIGGNATADQWTLTAYTNPEDPTQGTAAFSGATGVWQNVIADATYQLAESGGPATYVQDDNRTDLQHRPLSTGSWRCIQVDANGDMLGNYSDGINGGASVPLGAYIDCTATNRTAQLTILKTVINDHVGDQVASAWSLTATPGSVPSVAGLTPTTVTGAENESAANTFFVRPGHGYTLTETGPTGYAATLERWATGGWTTVDPTTPVTVAVGQHDIYRWVNNDNAADLEVALLVEPSFNRDYDWAISKSVDSASARVRPGENATFEYDVVVTSTGPTDSNFILTGTLNVTNPNFVAVVATIGSATGVAGLTCTLVPGDVTIPAADDEGPGGGQIPFTCTMPAGTTAGSAGSVSVTVTWDVDDLPGTTGTATGSKGYGFAGVTPSVTDQTVVVSDTAPEFATTYTEAQRTLDATVLLAGTGSKTFTYTRALGDEVVGGRCLAFPNTASIAQTVTQPGLSSGKSVEVCAGQNLSVSKVVVSSLTRTYDWDLEKSANHTRLAVGPDGTATFTYTVTAVPKPYSDSSWAMSGTITVTNPNKWDVTGVTVTDVPDIGGGVECVVTNGTNATIPAATDAAAGSKQFAYVCTFSSAPNPTGINTAKAAWDADQAGSPVAEATGTAPIGSNWTITPINDQVTVIDDKTNPADPKVLGTAKWSEGEKSFTYTLVLNGPGSNDQSRCKAYTNTAAIQGLPDQAKETVQVCAPEGDVAKDVVSTTQNADFNWTVVYDVTVTNLSAEDALYYDLDDEFDFGAGATILTASVVAPDGVTASGTWDGLNDTRIVTAQSLAPDGTHVYRITVNVAADISGEVVQLECVDGESGAFRNLTAIEFPGGSDSAEACSAPASPVVEKNRIGAVQDPVTGHWMVSYQVIVSNPSLVDVAYLLRDVPADLPPDVELVGNWSVTGPEITGGGSATLTPGWTGIYQTEVATGALPAKGEVTAKHVFTITGTVRIPASVPDSDLLCDVDGGEGGGIINNASVTNGLIDSDDSDCITIERPEVDLAKNVLTTLQLADGTWQITYAVVVTNTSELAAVYNLADVLDFGGDIVVNEANWTGPTGSGDFVGNSATLATDQVITSNDVDIYVVTVNATVSSAAWDKGETLECINGEEGAETGGFLNRAVVTVNGDDSWVDNCSEPSLPRVAKIGAGAVQDPSDASKWLVSYLITVTGGEHDTFYSLTDDPGFAPGIILGTGSAQRTDIAEQPTLAITAGEPFVTGVSLPGGAIHAYRVTWLADVTVEFDPADLDLQCTDEPVEGRAFYNSIKLSVGDVVIDDEVCIPVDERVYPTVSKTETSTKEGSNGNWTITYDVVAELAANEKGLAAEYDLTDTLDFGDGITVVEAKWTGPAGASGTFTGNEAILATDKTIASGTEHVYQVTVVAKVSASAFADKTHLCQVVEGQPKTGGFLNTVLLRSGNQDAKAFDCSEPTPPVTPPPPVTGATGTSLLPVLATVLIAVAGGGLLVRQRRKALVIQE